MKKALAIASALALVGLLQTPAHATMAKPGFVSWSEKFDLSTMSNRSQAEFTNWINKNTSTSPIEYHTNIKDPWYLKAYLYSAKAVESINPEAKVVLGSSNASTKAILDNLGLWHPGSNGNVCFPGNGNTVIGCNSFQNLGIVVLVKMDKTISAQSTLAHENFHSVQSYLAHYAGFNTRRLPSWFEEGSAEYFGYESYANANKIKYFSIRTKTSYGPSTTGNLADYELSESNAYDIGKSAIEYLVASKGFQPVVDVFADYGNGIPFGQSFEKRFGITLDAFYKKFLIAKNNVLGLVK